MILPLYMKNVYFNYLSRSLAQQIRVMYVNAIANILQHFWNLILSISVSISSPNIVEPNF